MRPTVTVIVPFAGTDAQLDAALEAVGRLELRAGDELLVADNRPHPRPGLVDASGPASSYFARDVAARRAKGEWLVFLDADCVPEPGLLDAYFAPAPGERTGALAGAIEDWSERGTLVARHIERRRKLSQETTLAHPRPYGQTANLAVRRAAFEEAGGWPDPVRSGGDADLCWRLAATGWALEPRPHARVRHRNRTTLKALLAQMHRHGSGMQWLDRRYPGSFPPPSPREIAARTKLLARGEWIEYLARWAADFGRLRANGDPTPVRSRA
jgi:GT2 family glycosyltransferase